LEDLASVLVYVPPVDKQRRLAEEAMEIVKLRETSRIRGRELAEKISKLLTGKN
jgi:hypothetical protein